MRRIFYCGKPCNKIGRSAHTALLKELFSDKERAALKFNIMSARAIV